MNYTPYYFAEVYGAGTYNSKTYNSSTSTGTSAGTTGSGSPLANTGFDLMLAATLGSVIIFTALIIRVWKRPAKKSPTQISE